MHAQKYTVRSEFRGREVKLRCYAAAYCYLQFRVLEWQVKDRPQEAFAAILKCLGSTLEAVGSH